MPLQVSKAHEYIRHFLLRHCIVDLEDGGEMILDLAYRLAKRAYKFE